jgi:hypothetical protein
MKSGLYLYPDLAYQLNSVFCKPSTKDGLNTKPTDFSYKLAPEVVLMYVLEFTPARKDYAHHSVFGSISLIAAIFH